MRAFYGAEGNEERDEVRLMDVPVTYQGDGTGWVALQDVGRRFPKSAGCTRRRRRWQDRRCHMINM